MTAEPNNEGARQRLFVFADWHAGIFQIPLNPPRV
jgi:hypothetical protein